MCDSLKYKILKDEKLGRYLVANTFLKKGTSIFTDVPFAIGPKPDSIAVCLGCHKRWDGSYQCSKCAWPCCNKTCEKSSLHCEYECKVFSEAKEKFQSIDIRQPAIQLDCITPLRVLLAKEKDPERWKAEVMIMEDHDTERRQKLTWDMDQHNIVQYLRLRCKLKNRFSEHLIEKVCGILEVNAVEVPSQNGPNIRAIYPKVGIMSHNCIPTVVHTIISGGKNGVPKNFAQVWSSIDIQEGDKLEMCYTNVMQSTMQRREYLERSKFFCCDCDRCADPTEFGTNMSTLKCNYCEHGLVLPIHPLDKETEWACNKCNFSTTSLSIKNMLQIMEQELGEAEQRSTGLSQIEQQEQAIQWCQNALHAQHSVLTCLKYSLSQLYGHIKGYTLEELSVDLLKRKIEMCQQVMEILNVISPGQTRIRGMLLYELHLPLVKLTKIEYKEGSITAEQFKKKISEIAELLHEAREILSREDENSEKGLIGRASMAAYNDLLKSI